jgi:hypothetical protein
MAKLIIIFILMLVFLLGILLINLFNYHFSQNCSKYE